MQKIAFRELLERYQDYDISPANQSLDQLWLRCSQKDRYSYFIDVNGNPVGVLSVTDKQDGSHKRLSPMDTKKEKPSDFMIEIRRLFARCIELTGKPDCKPGFPIFPFARLDCLNDPSGACLFSTELATGVFQTGTLRLGLLTRFDLKRNRIGLILFNLIFL